MQLHIPRQHGAPLVGYGLAVVLSLLTVLLRLTLSPALEDVGALTLFIVPVIISSWYGGLGPGLLATMLCGLAINYVLLDPIFSLAVTRRSDQIRLGLFFLDALLIVGLMERLHRSRAAEARASRTVRESEEQLRSILDSLFAFVGVLTPDARVVQANRTAVAAIGLDAADVIGRPFADLQCWAYDPAVKAGLQAATTQASQGNVVRYDVEIQGADGRLISIDFVLAPMRNAAGQVSYLIPSGIDITERKQAEARLAQKEAQLAAIIDSAMDAIITVDSDQHIMLFNAAADQMFGYTYDEMIGQNMSRLIPEAARARHGSHVTTFGQTKVTKRSMQSLLPLTALRRSGDEFPIEASISQIDVAGQKLFTVIIRDITERRRAEASLAQQATTLAEQARLLELAHDAITVHAFHSGTIQYWNPGAERLYGWSKDHAVGQSIHALLQTQFPHALDSILAHLLEHESWDGELTHTTHQSEHRIVTSRWALMRHADGTPRAVLEINRDITLQKQAERAVTRALADEQQARHTAEQAYALLDTLFTTAPIGLAFVDRELRYQRINQSLAEMNGHMIAAHIGKTPSELLPDLAPTLVPLWQHILATGAPVTDLEIDGTTPAAPNRHRHWLASYYPVRLPNGTIGGIGALVVEITERKQAEQQIRRYAERLHALHEIDRAILAVQPPQIIAASIVTRVRDIVGSTTATIALLDPPTGDAILVAVADDRQAKVSQGGRISAAALTIPPPLYAGESYATTDLTEIIAPSTIDQVAPSPRSRSRLLVPIRIAGTLRGTLNLGSEDADAFTDEQRLIAREVADQFAIALHNTELFAAVTESRERLQALSHRLVEVQEAERRALARELHDEIGQVLTAVQMRLQATARLSHAAELTAALAESMTTVQLALQQVRTLSLNLRPSILDDLGLEPALEWYLERQEQASGFAAILKVDLGDQRLPAHLETVCFRIVQEAVTNVMRYAQANRVDISVVKHEREVVLLIVDDGVGFDVQAAMALATGGRSVGLLGMQERVVLAGGTLTITSRPGRTEIQAVVPLTSPSLSEHMERMT